MIGVYGRVFDERVADRSFSQVDGKECKDRCEGYLPVSVIIGRVAGKLIFPCCSVPIMWSLSTQRHYDRSAAISAAFKRSLLGLDHLYQSFRGLYFF
jgi:hypothetical protein